jgi:hypothetical protein
MVKASTSIPPDPAPAVTKMRDAVAKAEAKTKNRVSPAILTAAYLRGQELPAPKSADKDSPLEDLVQNILANIDGKEGLPDNLKPAGVERVVRLPWKHCHPDIKLPHRRTLKRAYTNYLAKRPEK